MDAKGLRGSVRREGAPDRSGSVQTGPVRGGSELVGRRGLRAVVAAAGLGLILAAALPAGALADDAPASSAGEGSSPLQIFTSIGTSLGGDAATGPQSAEGTSASSTLSTGFSVQDGPSSGEVQTDGSGFSYTLDADGDATLAGYDGGQAEVEVPSELDGHPVVAVGAGAFAGDTALTSVALPDSVLQIGDGAFKGCTALTSVALPPSLQWLGAEAFSGCTALASIELPGSLAACGTSWQQGSAVGPFAGCTSLAEVAVGDGATTLAPYIFAGCDALSVLTLPGSLVSVDAVAFSNSGQVSPELVVRGLEGSAAQRFAEEMGLTFQSSTVPATAISVSQAEISLFRGATAQLEATVAPEDSTDRVTWQSSNPEVASVDDQGTVAAVAAGSATITATAGSVSVTCAVTVTVPVESIELNRASFDLEAAETRQMVTTVLPEDATDKSVTWTSSDTSVATVGADGTVTGVAEGTATLTATANDGSGVKATAKVDVVSNRYTVDAPEKLASPHDYAANCLDCWVYTLAGAEALDVTFDERTFVENTFDYIEVYDGSDGLVGTYTGSELAGATVRVPGDTVRIKLVTDGQGSAWGFAVTGVAAVQVNGWRVVDGITYYYENGAPVKGERLLDDGWHYFDVHTGAMLTGLVRLPDGRLVYYDARGVMQTGDVLLQDGWHYFDPVDGHMVTGLYCRPDGWFYYNRYGVRCTGPVVINGTTYYFNDYTGVMVSDPTYVDVDITNINNETNITNVDQTIVDVDQTVIIVDSDTNIDASDGELADDEEGKDADDGEIPVTDVSDDPLPEEPDQTEEPDQPAGDEGEEEGSGQTDGEDGQTEQPAEEQAPVEQPADGTEQVEGEQPAEQPADGTPAEQAENQPENPAEQAPVEEPAGEQTEQPAEEQPAEQPAEEQMPPTEQPAEEQAEQAPTEGSDEGAEQQQPAEGQEPAEEQPVEGSDEQVPAEEPTGEQTEQPAEQPAEEQVPAEEQPVEGSDEQAPAVEQPAEEPADEAEQLDQAELDALNAAAQTAYQAVLDSGDYAGQIEPVEGATYAWDYAFFDVNADGVNELLVRATTDDEFSDTVVYAYDAEAQSAVCAGDLYGYGADGPQYSPSSNAIVNVPTSPSDDTAAYVFVCLDGASLDELFTVGRNQGAPYYREAGASEDAPIGEDELQGYLADTVLPEYQPVPMTADDSAEQPAEEAAPVEEEAPVEGDSAADQSEGQPAVSEGEPASAEDAPVQDSPEAAPEGSAPVEETPAVEEQPSVEEAPAAEEAASGEEPAPEGQVSEEAAPAEGEQASEEQPAVPEEAAPEEEPAEGEQPVEEEQPVADESQPAPEEAAPAEEQPAEGAAPAEGDLAAEEQLSEDAAPAPEETAPAAVEPTAEQTAQLSSMAQLYLRAWERATVAGEPLAAEGNLVVAPGSSAALDSQIVALALGLDGEGLDGFYARNGQGNLAGFNVTAADGAVHAAYDALPAILRSVYGSDVADVSYVVSPMIEAGFVQDVGDGWSFGQTAGSTSSAMWTANLQFVDGTASFDVALLEGSGSPNVDSCTLRFFHVEAVQDDGSAFGFHLVSATEVFGLEGAFPDAVRVQSDLNNAISAGAPLAQPVTNY